MSRLLFIFFYLFVTAIIGEPTLRIVQRNADPREDGETIVKVLVVADSVQTKALPLVDGRGRGTVYLDLGSSDVFFTDLRVIHISEGGFNYIPAGSDRTGIALQAVDDNDAFEDESVTFFLKASPNYTRGNSSVTIRIVDDDWRDPNPPTSLMTVTNGVNRIDISWAHDGLYFPSYFALFYANENSPFVQGQEPFATVEYPTLSFSHTGNLALTNDYYLRAVNINGSSTPSVTNRVILSSEITLPDAPSDALLTPLSSSSLKFDYTDNSTNENNFIIETNHNAGSWAAYATNLFDITTLTIEGAPAQTPIQARVKATNEAGDSPWSNIAQAMTHPSDLSVPANLRTNASTGSTIELWWDDVANEEGYVLERSLAEINWTNIADLAINVTNYTDTGLPASWNGFYRICATNGTFGLKSPFTAGVAGATTPNIPDIPTGLSVATLNSTNLLVSWDVMANTVDYDVRWGQTSGDLTNNVLAVTQTQTILTNLEPTRTYYAQVRAANAAGDSDWAAEAFGTTAGSINLVGFAGNAAGGQPLVQLDWTPVAGATSYEVRLLDPATRQWRHLTCTTNTSLASTNAGYRLFIPCYDDPGPGADFWDDIIAVGSGKLGMVIANDQNGPTIGAEDPEYSSAIAQVTLLGADVLGYVYTGDNQGGNEGGRPLAAVKTDIDKWFDDYADNGLKGIFFDEVGKMQSDDSKASSSSAFQTLAQAIAYYTDLRNYVSAKAAGAITVLNGGNRPLDQLAPDYVLMSNPLLIFEDTDVWWLAQQQPSYYQSYDFSQFATLVENFDGNSALQRECLNHAKAIIGTKYFYFTDLVSDHWGSKTGGWTELLARIANYPELTFHTFQVRVESPWVGTWSNEFTVQTGDDLTGITGNSAPTATIILPTGSTFTSLPVDFEATASDIDGTIQRVEFRDGNAILHTEFNAPYTFNFSAANGTYTIVARAYDDDGDHGDSAGKIVTLNVPAANQNPVVTLTAPTNGMTFTNSNDITLSATASDDGTVDRVEFYNGGARISTDFNSPYSDTWQDVANGSYTIFARAFDDQGASATSAGAAITVNVGAPVPNPDATADYYFSTSGSSSNPGTFASPWSLSHVASGAGGVLSGGDIVEGLPGTYDIGTNQTLLWTVNGDPGNPIVIRGPRDWTVAFMNDGASRTSGADKGHNMMQIGTNSSANGGNYLRFEFIRFYQNQPDRLGDRSGKRPGTDVLPLTDGILIEARGVELVHCIVHDFYTGVEHFANQNGGLNRAVGGLIYGCLMMNNGMQDATESGFPNSEGNGSDMYIQNGPERFTLKHNVFLGGWDFFNVQLSGSNTDTKNTTFEENVFYGLQLTVGWQPDVDDVYVLGNIFFNANLRFGGISGSGNRNRIQNNRIYYDLSTAWHTGDADHNSPFSITRQSDPSVTGNRVWRLNRPSGVKYGRPSSSSSFSSWSVSGNRFNVTDFNDVTSGERKGGISQWRSDLSNSDTNDLGSYTDNVMIWPSEEADKCAIIVVENASEASSVAVNFGSFLANGDTYKVYNLEDIQDGTDPNVSIITPVPVVSGTFTGANVTLPNINSTARMPVINNTAAVLDLTGDTMFAVFCVVGE